MSNPHVRAHLRFFPEDAGCRLAEAWQAKRWLTELDFDLATPMCRQEHQDFYTLEPALLADGRVCMPFRWFTRRGQTFARTWALEVQGNATWLVRQDIEFDVPLSAFLLNLPGLVQTYAQYQLPDPRRILGKSSG